MANTILLCLAELAIGLLGLLAFNSPLSYLFPLESLLFNLKLLESFKNINQFIKIDVTKDIEFLKLKSVLIDGSKLQKPEDK